VKARSVRSILSALVAGVFVFPLWAELDTPDVPFENTPYNGRFTFPRIRFEPTQWGRGPHYWGLDLKWNHDYPRGESHLMKILGELTFITTNPEGNILKLDDPELFKYPWAYVCEVGFWRPTDAEALALRNYLLKGGFLVVDDFMDGWRGYAPAWDNFTAGMRQVLPDARLVQLEANHPIFDSFFHIENPYFLRSPYPVDPIYYGIFEDNDPKKRLMVIANYNHDIGEFWEWSDTGWVPIDITNEAYKLGVNYVMYGMTH